MIELYLERTIAIFDGTILEVFPSGQSSQRYHVRWIKSAEIQVDKKGRQSLQVFMKGGGGFVTSDLPLEAQATAAELVVALRASMTP